MDKEFDLMLPPMLARYRVSGWEVACLGHGGYWFSRPPVRPTPDRRPWRRQHRGHKSIPSSTIRLMTGEAHDLVFQLDRLGGVIEH
jgi:hypothetical protein